MGVPRKPLPREFRARAGAPAPRALMRTPLPGGGVGFFVPIDDPVQVGGARWNPPAGWAQGGSLWEGRIVVGLNVGRNTVWSVDDVIEQVYRIRLAQGLAPRATFTLQRGLWTETLGAATVSEPSVLITIYNDQGTKPKRFFREIIALAETVAARLSQQAVILHVLKNGKVWWWDGIYATSEVDPLPLPAVTRENPRGWRRR